jgi:hypothetical protein
MKYFAIPIKEYESIIRRGREIERKQPLTPKEQYSQIKNERSNKPVGRTKESE